jgi:hypothetical protein
MILTRAGARSANFRHQEDLLARPYNFEFKLSAPVTLEEINAWREREGLTENETPLRLVDGTFIAFTGDRGETGNRISDYLPRFRDWLAGRDIEMSYLRGDFCPPTFGRDNPLARI